MENVTEGEWYWLQNTLQNTYGASAFARLNFSGGASFANASNSLGVRPVFLLNL